MICAPTVRKPMMAKALVPRTRIVRKTASPTAVGYKVTLDTPDGKQEIECASPCHRAGCSPTLRVP
jgi:hypothetical protein